MPYYSMRIGSPVTWLKGPFSTSLGEEFGVAVHSGGICPVYMIAREGVFDREGIYGPTEREAYPDNMYRFSFFSRAVLGLVSHHGPSFDIVHCHDWHTGVLPALCRLAGGPRTVMTIHNLSFQGRFPGETFSDSGLPPALFSMDAYEFYGDFCFLKGGILLADRVTTVSPTYRAEVRTPAFGEGLDGVLRSRGNAFRGILNGLDFALWGPDDDPALAAWYTDSNLRNRKACREDLVQLGGLSVPPGTPVAGIVSRLTRQKGIDLLLPALEELLGSGRLCLAAVGTGEREIEDGLGRLARDFPESVYYRNVWDETLSRKIYAGTDMFLMPSRFEPCGLTQMIAMRYGSLPVVRRTGGLADTVTPFEEGGTGFLFEGESSAGCSDAISRAVEAFGDRRAWMAAMRKAMSLDNSWADRVPDYEAVYSEAAEPAGGA